MTEDIEKQKADAEEAKRQRTIVFAVSRYGIKPEDFVWHNSGICYDSLVVNNREAAEKAAESVKGGHVNGGMLHGMPLGGISDEPGGNFRVTV